MKSLEKNLEKGSSEEAVRTSINILMKAKPEVLDSDFLQAEKERLEKLTEE